MVEVDADKAVYAVVAIGFLLLLIGVQFFWVDAWKVAMKEQAVDQQADRVENAAMALDSYPEGSIEVPIKGYRFDYRSGEINISIADSFATRSVGQSTGYDQVQWKPGEPREVKSSLCLSKKASGGQELLEFEVGGC